MELHIDIYPSICNSILMFRDLFILVRGVVDAPDLESQSPYMTRNRQMIKRGYKLVYVPEGHSK